jgi:hypothetical protein
MKEHWEKNLRLRMQGLRKEAPEGLFDEIKKEMERREISFRPTLRPIKVIRLWAYRSAAAAAILLTALFLILHSSKHDLYTFRESGSPLASKTADQSIPLKAPFKKASRTQQDYAPQKNIYSSNITVSSPVSDTTNAAIKSAIDKTDTTSTDNKAIAPYKKEVNKDNYAYRNGYETVSLNHIEQKSRLSFGTSYSGAFGTTSDFGPQNLMAASDPLSFDDFPSKYAINNSTIPPKIKTKTRHHLPVKFELSLQYHLNDRWSIQTGINYSYLSSDFTYESVLATDIKKQDLHYLGIPVAFSYTLHQGMRYAVYGIAGMEAAKMINGHSTENNAQRNNIKEKRLQYSANAGLGAELKINQDFSIFAEPGVSYYFNNGSQIENIYKTKPLNIDLKFGLRINITNR